MKPRACSARNAASIDDPSKSSDLPKAAVDWARRQLDCTDQDSDHGDLRQSSVVTAAMIAMRDGDADLRGENRSWADAVFAGALREKEDPVHRMRPGLRFNRPAIAFAGMVHALKDGVRPGDLRTLLDAAASSDPAAAHGFGSVAPQLTALDERLPRSLLRCAFTAAVRVRRRWDALEAEAVKDAETYRRKCETAVAAELAWLNGGAPEPAWPIFPSEAARPRRRRLPRGTDTAPPPASGIRRDDEYVDHQAGALWLSSCHGLFDARKRTWLLGLVRAYSEWTATANGAGLAASEEVMGKPTEWNEAYFDALANCLPAMSPSELDELALDPLQSLPDEPFLDASATFIRDVDDVFFNDRGLTPEEAVRIRSVLAGRLEETGGWRSTVRRRSSSIEMHLGPAAGAMFFNNHGFVQRVTAYVLPKGIDSSASAGTTCQRCSLPVHRDRHAEFAGSLAARRARLSAGGCGQFMGRCFPRG
jgi:hypothetical protein